MKWTNLIESEWGNLATGWTERNPLSGEASASYASNAHIFSVWNKKQKTWNNNNSQTFHSSTTYGSGHTWAQLPGEWGSFAVGSIKIMKESFVTNSQCFYLSFDLLLAPYTQPQQILKNPLGFFDQARIRYITVHLHFGLETRIKSFSNIH
jgi:hypothetical protein